MTDEILTLKEVADYLKLAEKTAYRLAAEARALPMRSCPLPPAGRQPVCG